MWLSDFLKQPTVPVLKQVQNQRTIVSSFWRGNVRNQRTISSGYFQKHERTGRFCRQEPEKDQRLGRQRFLKFSKELSSEDLYQNSDQFFIKRKNHLQQVSGYVYNAPRLSWVYVCVPRLSGKEGFEGRLPW